MKRMLLVSLIGCSFLVACAGGVKTSETKELRTQSDQTQLQNRANIRLQLAIGYFEARQFETALDEIKQALISDPNNAEAHGVRALIYMEMGEVELADSNFKNALRLAPNNPDISNNYGWYLCRNHRVEEAIKYFENALEIRTYASPEKALNNAGMCRFKQKKWELAEKYFMQAFKFAPGNLATNTNLARVFFQKNEFERARFYLSRVTNAGKNNILPADVLWLAIRIERKLGDSAAEGVFATQLRRHHANSQEYLAWQRGAFDE